MVDLCAFSILPVALRTFTLISQDFSPKSDERVLLHMIIISTEPWPHL